MTMPARGGNDYMSPPPPPMPNHQQPRVLPQHDSHSFSSPARGYGQPPPIMEHNVPPAGYHHHGGHNSMPGAVQPEHYEYQVNDVLDSYYDGGDQQYDGPAEQQHYQGPRRGSAGPAVPGVHHNPPRGFIEGYDPSWEAPQPNSNTAFAAHAHRSRSQPNLRGAGQRGSEQSGYSQNGQVLPVEMLADIPPMPTSPSRSGTFPSQAELPPVLRVKTPAPGQRPNQTPGPQNGQQQYPPPPLASNGQQQYPPGQYPPTGQQQYAPGPIVPGSMVLGSMAAGSMAADSMTGGSMAPGSTTSGSMALNQQYPPGQMPPNGQQYSQRPGPDSLPYHPSPVQSNRSSNPDALPEHPAPIRLGLMQDQQQPPMGPGHPPPVRQYSPRESMDNRSQQGPPPKGPLTQVELEQAIKMAKAAPNDQALQLALAKKYIQAADVLADEGGRADARTTKKNRENYIFDAHKIIKKLANGVIPNLHPPSYEASY